MSEGINWDEEVQYKTVELEKIKLVVMSYLDSRLAQFAIDPKVEIVSQVEWAAESIAIRIEQQVFGREVQRQECEWPRDWWQAFKERWYPAWAKRRWPVEYERYVITARELYPQMALPSDRYQGVITIAKRPRW